MKFHLKLSINRLFVRVVYSVLRLKELADVILSIFRDLLLLLSNTSRLNKGVVLPLQVKQAVLNVLSLLVVVPITYS